MYKVYKVNEGNGGLYTYMNIETETASEATKKIIQCSVKRGIPIKDFHIFEEFDLSDIYIGIKELMGERENDKMRVLRSSL